MQKLSVRNFQQISSADIEIKNFLILIGEQGSGKSTLAKLIYFFKSLKEDYFNLIYENANRNEKNLEIIFIKRIQDKFNIYFGYTTDLPEDFEIIFYYNFAGNSHSDNRYLKLSKIRALNIQFDDDYFGKILKNTRELVGALNDFTQTQARSDANNFIALERIKTRFITELTERINSLFFDSYSPMFFPAGRSITVSYPEQFQTLFLGNLNSLSSSEKISRSVDLLQMKSFILYSKFLNDYFKGSSFDTKIDNCTDNRVSNQALVFFKKHAEYILQGKYVNFNGNERLVFDTQKNKSVPFNLASSGQQESIRIIQDLFYLLYEKQKSFRIIEEPEAHLYPLAQKKLIELISLISNCTQSQIVITTHSPYILTVLNNLLMYSVTCQNEPSNVNRITEYFGTQNLNAENNERINLSFSDVQAYALSTQSEKYCTSIIDSETGLVGENYLDRVTEELNTDFNFLYNINF